MDDEPESGEKHSKEPRGEDDLVGNAQVGGSESSGNRGKRKAEEGGYSLTDDYRYSVYEVHADLLIDGIDNSEDEIAKPYVVTIERGSNEILSIRRNWNQDDMLMLKRQHFVHYVYFRYP